MSSRLSKAMILAAGFGTRLRPLSDNLPKALVPYNGKPMIENVVLKLISSGIGEITINTHYLGDEIKEFFGENNFDAKINITSEEVILGIGGGIKNAGQFLKNSGNFLVHNVDVTSDIDFQKVYEHHTKHGAIATLCVKKRETARHLLIDTGYNLVGRIGPNREEFYRETPASSRTAFCGVYILSAKVFKLFPDEKVFDIMPFLFGLVRDGEKVICYDIGDTYWKDLGKIEDLKA